MQTMDPKEELRKVRVALILNLTASALMLIGLVISVSSGVVWRIACSSIATVAFFFLSFAIFTRLLKLQKQLNS